MPSFSRCFPCFSLSPSRRLPLNSNRAVTSQQPSVRFFSSRFAGCFFLVSCVRLAVKAITKCTTNALLRALLGIGGAFVLLVTFLYVFGVLPRKILNASRPIDPKAFMANDAQLDRLTELSRELIARRRVIWVGNDRNGFAFGIGMNDGDYLFTSESIPEGHDFRRPVSVEDMNKDQHVDLPIRQRFKPTERKTVSQEDYEFCVGASKTIRKAGLDNVKLYRDSNVVKYEIRDFVGWDLGTYYIYLFSPTGEFPEGFGDNERLGGNWYFFEGDRFP